MDSKTISRMVYGLLRWSRQLSWAWMAFFALMALALGFYLAVVMPMRHGIVATKTQVENMRQNMDSLQQTAVDAAKQGPAGQLEAFEAYFPTESSATDTLELIVKEATLKGLVPKGAEYRINKSTPGNVLGYQLTLPLKGTYPQLVEFIADILPKVKNISLDSISFQRQKISDTQPDATLVLTLYLRREQ